MSSIYKHLVRPILFKQDPERAHEFAVHTLHSLSKFNYLCKLLKLYNKITGSNPIHLFGLKFPNHIGLAAGFDKNAKCWKVAEALGFGHIEIGTITNQPQPGNPKPRLFRVPEQHALINQMGFNNDGAQAIAQRLANDHLKNKTHAIPLGINIGKSRIIPLEEAVSDYVASFNTLAPYADFFTINVSSPNTPGLRQLQGNKFLPDLLKSIQETNFQRAKNLAINPIPILLKISPDLSFQDIDLLLESALNAGVSGIVATNTTQQRPNNAGMNIPKGGLSGSPLNPLSINVIKYISRSTNGNLPIIGVGGIMTPESAGAVMDAGASMLQIYTGLIYEGPFIAKHLAQSLSWHSKDWL